MGFFRGTMKGTGLVPFTSIRTLFWILTKIGGGGGLPQLLRFASERNTGSVLKDCSVFRFRFSRLTVSMLVDYRLSYCGIADFQTYALHAHTFSDQKHSI